MSIEMKIISSTAFLEVFQACQSFFSRLYNVPLETQFIKHIPFIVKELIKLNRNTVVYIVLERGKQHVSDMVFQIYTMDLFPPYVSNMQFVQNI
jgi:hypothetical protein